MGTEPTQSPREHAARFPGAKPPHIPAPYADPNPDPELVPQPSPGSTALEHAQPQTGPAEDEPDDPHS